MTSSLFQHYRTIGTALLEFERDFGSLRSMLFGVGDDRTTGVLSQPIKSFSVSVSFVPVEILESYFDDLLDIGVEESSLFIEHKRFILPSVFISLCGLLVAIAVGLFSVTAGATFGSAFMVTILLALPFGLFWHFAPKDRLARRIDFAKLLSQIIARRRGRDADGTSSEFLRRLVRGRRESIQGAAFSPLVH